MFRIHGKQYGIARIGGLSFSNDPDTIRLNDFRFRINETFLYEYDFTDDWRPDPCRSSSGTGASATLSYMHRWPAFLSPRRLWWSESVYGVAAAVLTWPYHDAVNRYN